MKTKQENWNDLVAKVKLSFGNWPDTTIIREDEEIRIRWTNHRAEWTHCFFIALLEFCRTWNVTFHVDADGVAIYFHY